MLRWSLIVITHYSLLRSLEAKGKAGPCRLGSRSAAPRVRHERPEFDHATTTGERRQTRLPPLARRGLERVTPRSSSDSTAQLCPPITHYTAQPAGTSREEYSCGLYARRTSSCTSACHPLELLCGDPYRTSQPTPALYARFHMRCTDACSCLATFVYAAFLLVCATFLVCTVCAVVGASCRFSES